MLPKKKKKQLTYLDIRQEYLDSGVTNSAPPSIIKETKDEPSSSSSSGNDENNLSTDLRVKASEKRDILLYYILENFYTIDEVHKNKLYAFLLKLTELKAIDFDPFVQPGLYSQFRSQLDQVMLDVKNKGSVLPLLHGIHSSNYNYNMVSRAAVDFETVCFLGKGGFGEVIKARNRIDGAMYALKKVKFRDLPNSEKNLEKVLREVKALAQLDHENVLRYFNAWIEVEHAGDYTKKMLEAVSHKPQLPSTLPVSPLSLSPPQSKLSVAVSDYSYEENENSEDSEDSGSDNSEEEDESGSRFYPTATSTTDSFYKEEEEEETEEDEDEDEDEDGEEDEEDEEEEDGEEEDGESCDSLRSSSGVDVHFVEGFGSLNLNEDSTTSSNSNSSNSYSNNSSNSNSNSTMSSESSGHTIVTLNGSSGSSSHGSRHGINVPIYTSSELSNGSNNTTSNEERKTKKGNGSKGFHSPMVSLKGKKDNRTATHNNKVIHGHTKHHHAHVHTHALHTTHPSNGRRLRMSFESMLTNFRRGHEYTQEEKKKEKSTIHSKDKEKEKGKKGKTKVKGSDESEEDWKSVGTSASKEFSHELSTLPYPSISSLSSVPSAAPISPSKALAVVPFKPPAATPPKNRYVLYIQMQLCETRTLKSFLEAPGRAIKIVDNMVIFSQIVTGLNHIHSKGLIHRDLKPENLFFSPSGAIKIGDFGLSKQFSDMSATNKDIFDSCPSPHTVGVGTRSYASPEQIKSNFYTAKSDMYSLGIILFELFNIFDTHTERAKVLQDLRARIVPPIFYGRFPEVARCVLWLMEEMPENRPTTDEILRNSFMTLSQGPCSVTSLVVKQQEEIDKLQEKILMLQEQLKLASAGNITG